MGEPLLQGEDGNESYKGGGRGRAILTGTDQVPDKAARKRRVVNLGLCVWESIYYRILGDHWN